MPEQNDNFSDEEFKLHEKDKEHFYKDKSDSGPVKDPVYDIDNPDSDITDPSHENNGQPREINDRSGFYENPINR